MPHIRKTAIAALVAAAAASLSACAGIETAGQGVGLFDNEPGSLSEARSDARAEHKSIKKDSPWGAVRPEGPVPHGL